MLGLLSHQSLATADPDEALLLGKSGLAGLGGDVPALVRVLLLHRVAMAAAHAGERLEAEATLVQAGQAVERCVPGEAPEWLYWLDEAELRAMTGRCWAMLGRPLRAVRLLASRPATAWPRTATLDGVWLARSYLQLGEVEQACWAAGRAWSDAVSAGSTRAADAVRHLHPLLLRHRDVRPCGGTGNWPSWRPAVCRSARTTAGAGDPAPGRWTKGWPQLHDRRPWR